MYKYAVFDIKPIHIIIKSSSQVSIYTHQKFYSRYYKPEVVEVCVRSVEIRKF